MFEQRRDLSNDACTPTLDFRRIAFSAGSAKPRRLLEPVFTVLLCELVRFQAEEKDNRFCRLGAVILHWTLSSYGL
jgi:hypothetical protein